MTRCSSVGAALALRTLCLDGTASHSHRDTGAGDVERAEGAPGAAQYGESSSACAMVREGLERMDRDGELISGYGPAVETS